MFDKEISGLYSIMFEDKSWNVVHYATYRAMQYKHKRTYLRKCIDFNKRKEMEKILFNTYNPIK